MSDELEERRQRRQRTREGMIRWVQSLREEMPTDTRGFIAAETSLSPDLLGAVQRVLSTCTNEDIVDMLALGAGAHLWGEIRDHIASVQFVETEAGRAERLAKATT